jgi:hypothetical protein
VSAAEGPGWAGAGLTPEAGETQGGVATGAGVSHVNKLPGTLAKAKTQACEMHGLSRTLSAYIFPGFGPGNGGGCGEGRSEFS